MMITIISTATWTPQVVVILDSHEEVKILRQLVVEEKLEQVAPPRPMEKEELLLTNRRSTQVQTQNFIERKLKHDAHNTEHNIKNSTRFLSHEIRKLV
jgi:hypothetical protein